MAFSVALATHSHASIVRDDVDYQYFRDFAENKGKFTVGASNIEIFDNSGNSVGTMLPNLPMFDFSVISRKNGVATLGADQHVVSVEHNSGYANVGFGGDDMNPDAHHFTYLITNRYDYSNTNHLALPIPNAFKNRPGKEDGYNNDYHTPRLHKLVTETAPVEMAENNLENYLDFFNTSKYSSFIRAGSGVQKTRNTATGTEVTKAGWAGAYLTGGVPMGIYKHTPEAINFGTNLTNTQYGPLVNFAQPGDSGSGMFAYNVAKQRWEFIATTATIATSTNNYLLNRPDYLKKVIANDTLQLDTAGGDFTWQHEAEDSSNSTISGNGNNLKVTLFDGRITNTSKKPANPALDHGKTVRINGTGSLTLSESINQGAGALYFNDNFTVKAADDSVTWQGAGVSVADGKNVEWKVKNPENDRLSKIGKGTLTVSGNGTNTGDISVGDGTVVLNQTNGTAFKRVGIVSGRPTVVLGAANQIDPNELYFGFRGGRLDMNGQDLNFNYIQNVDDGARIVNNNASKAANVTIIGRKLINPDDLLIRKWSQAGGDVYEYDHQGRKRYLASTTKQYSSWHPVNFGESNANWEFLSGDKATALRMIADRYDRDRSVIAFNGVFGETDDSKTNGALNVTYNPHYPQSVLLLSGGAKLNGNLTASNGTLLLSGRPTPHAYDFVGKKDVIFEEKYAADWINRTFNAGNIIVDNNATVHVGRNVSQVNANFTANDSARLSLGVIDGETPICIRSDHTGITQCDTAAMSAAATAGSPVTAINGNVQLNGASSLNLGKATLTGAVNGSGNVSLKTGSHWVMTDASNVGNLTADSGSTVTLSRSDDDTKTLTIAGALRGNGNFAMRTPSDRAAHDQIIVGGEASGTHTLRIADSGSEPQQKEAELFRAGSKNALSLLLNDAGTVDFGAFRYRLYERGNSFWLAVEPPKEEPEIQPETQPEETAPVVTNPEVEKQPEETTPKVTEPEVEKQPEANNPVTETAPETVKPEGEKQPEETAPKVTEPEVEKQPEVNNPVTETAPVVNNPEAEKQPKETAPKVTVPEVEKQPEANNPVTETAPVVNNPEGEKQPETNPDETAPKVTEPEGEKQPETQPDETAPKVTEPEVEKQPEANNPVTETAPVVTKPEVEKQPDAVEGEGKTEGGQSATESVSTEVTKPAPDADKPADKQPADENERRTAVKSVGNSQPEANLADIQAAYPHQKDYLSRYANAAISELSAQGNVLLGIGARLDREIAHVDEQGVRVWAETGKQSGRFSDKLYRPYSQDITLTQIGVENVSGETTLGGVLSRSAADNQFDDAIKGKNTLHQLDLYAKQRFSHGVFAALDAGFGKAESKVGDAEFSRSVVSLGATIGARWQAESGLYLAPSIGARHYRLGGSRYVFDGAVVGIKPLQLTSYQAGVSIGKRFDFGSFSITPEFASYAQAVKSAEKTVSVNGNALSHQFGNRFKHELSVGVQKGGLSVGLSAGVQHGGQLDRQRSANIKIGYRW